MNKIDREREAYKRVFSQIHIPQEVKLERKDHTLMKWTTKHGAAVGLAAALAGSCAAAYAADLGGIRTTVTVFFHGEQMEMEARQDKDGTWNFYTSDSNEPVSGGGGIAYEPDGTTRELGPEEVLEAMSEDVFEEDGRIWLSIKDKKWDITDDFDADDHAYLEIDSMYFDISRDAQGHLGNWSLSREKTAGITYTQLK